MRIRTQRPVACRRWLSILFAATLLLSGCNKFQHKAPDPTKGVITGIVLCSDTGKPARFATVTLTAAPKAGEKPTTVTRSPPLK